MARAVRSGTRIAGRRGTRSVASFEVELDDGDAEVEIGNDEDGSVVGDKLLGMLAGPAPVRSDEVVVGSALGEMALDGDGGDTLLTTGDDAEVDVVHSEDPVCDTNETGAGVSGGSEGAGSESVKVGEGCSPGAGEVRPPYVQSGPSGMDGP